MASSNFQPPLKKFAHPLKIQSVNGLHVKGGVFDHEFTKSLIIRDFDDFWKILLDVCIFSYYTHNYQRKFPKITMHDL